MSYPSNEEMILRANRYANSRRARIEHKLGDGKDGIVFQTSAVTAIKVFSRPETFNREKNCYLRLSEMAVHEILEHAVPQLCNVDEQLMVIEMSIVQPPFLLDFASAYT